MAGGGEGKMGDGHWGGHLLDEDWVFYVSDELQESIPQNQEHTVYTVSQFENKLSLKRKKLNKMGIDRAKKNHKGNNLDLQASLPLHLFSVLPRHHLHHFFTTRYDFLVYRHHLFTSPSFSLNCKLKRKSYVLYLFIKQHLE